MQGGSDFLPEIRRIDNPPYKSKGNIMDISVNAEVYCTDGHYGRSILIIVDPTNEKVTHLVVRENRFPHAQFLVPVDRVVNSKADSIELNCQHKEIALSVFEVE